MSNKVEELVTNMGNLTMMEAVALTKAIESTFGVSANVVRQSIIEESLVQTVEEEKEYYDVRLVKIDPSKKVPIIKVVRQITALGLKEAKDLVEAAPVNIKEFVSKVEAELIKAKLVEVGAEIELV